MAVIASLRFLLGFIICVQTGYYNFNLDDKFAEILSLDTKEDTYFGFSVLLQKGIPSRVLVGAPLANSTVKHLANVNRPGQLYRCSLGPLHDCEAYLLDYEVNGADSESGFPFHYKNKKDGQLLGACLDGGNNDGDPFVVCAPRWINDRRDRSGQNYLPNGICYRVSNSTLLTLTGEKLMPLLYSGKQGFTSGGVSEYYYAMGEAGMSIQYLEKENQYLLGAPGVLSWRGTVIRYRRLESTGLPAQLRGGIEIPLGRYRREVYDGVNVPNPHFFMKITQDSYFGYAVSYGKFRSNSSEIWYVAGAPRGAALLGQVLLYEYADYEDEDLLVRSELRGKQLGSYFGTALLAVDVSNSKASDLLIGAPSFTRDTWDEGCVYFFKNDGQGNFETSYTIFGDKQSGARFGTAISNLGDINYDSHPDVAIAAPYEDEGQGAVYIFLGEKKGISSRYSQRISAKTIDSTLKGFGFSMSRGLDIDNNYYNDLAIGAYKSGQVVVIKSRPVIKYKGKITASLKELSLNTSTFNITYCIMYDTSTNTVPTVETDLQVHLDNRATHTSNISQSVTATDVDLECSGIDITLKKGITDYSTPFTIAMLYRITELELKEFCPNCPMIDPNDSNEVVLEIPFANGCGEDSVCQPDLKVTAHIEDNLKALVIGLKNSIKLYVKVENLGEPAYLCELNFPLPEDVDIVQVPSNCKFKENEKVLECLVDNVIQPKMHVTMIFDLDIRRLDPKDKTLSLGIQVQSKGEEANSADDQLNLTIPLQLVRNMEITGSSNPDQFVIVDENNTFKSDLLVFEHQFAIRNLGPSPLDTFQIVFEIPVELVDAGSNGNKTIADVYEPEAFLDKQSVQCTTDYHLGFFSDEKPGEGTNDVTGDDAESIKSRLRREIGDVTNGKAAEEPFMNLPVNRTLFVNCTNPIITCMRVVCSGGQLSKSRQYVTVKFQIRSHIDVLHTVLGNKDLLLISSTAATNINGQVTKYSAKTLLIGSLKDETVSLWIIIVSILSALVILSVLVIVLYKLRFFSRPIREKLENEEAEGSGILAEEPDDEDEE